MKKQSIVREIPTAVPLYPFEAYSHVIQPISAEDGGGFMITFPDLPGCMSDGATQAEAGKNGRDAFLAWVSSVVHDGQEVPAPAFKLDAILPPASGKFVARVPKSLHARLAERAKREGVTMNALVVALLAEGIGRKQVA